MTEIHTLNNQTSVNERQWQPGLERHRLAKAICSLTVSESHENEFLCRWGEKENENCEWARHKKKSINFKLCIFMNGQFNENDFVIGKLSIGAVSSRLLWFWYSPFILEVPQNIFRFPGASIWDFLWLIFKFIFICPSKVRSRKLNFSGTIIVASLSWWTVRLNVSRRS